MSYGDGDKWGGCLEIYGDVSRRVMDLKFGCCYLPVNQEQKKTPINKPIHSLLNYLGFLDNIYNENQQWLQPTFDNLMGEPRHKKKDPLSFLYKNCLEYDNEKIEVPDKE